MHQNFKMKINFQNTKTQKASLTILFYVSAALIIFLLDIATPSGPCTPGLGILSFMLLPFISSVLLFKNFKKTYKGDKNNKLPLLIHFLFLVGFVIYLKLV